MKQTLDLDLDQKSPCTTSKRTRKSNTRKKSPFSIIRGRDILSFVSFVGMPWNNTPIRWISPGICRIFGSYLTSLVLSLNLHSFLFLVALSLAHHSSNSPPGAIQGAFLDSIFRQHRPSHSMSYSKKLVSTLYVAINSSLPFFVPDIILKRPFRNLLCPPIQGAFLKCIPITLVVLSIEDTFHASVATIDVIDSIQGAFLKCIPRTYFMPPVRSMAVSTS